MNKHYYKMRQRASLVGVMCGSMLFGLPAMAVPKTQVHQLSQINPNPSIFNEPPYSRRTTSTPEQAPGTAPNTPQAPGDTLQPPLPEQQQSPSAVVTPKNGAVTVTLINETGANIIYQVIGNTNQRLLKGKSNVLLQELPTPVSITFKRQDAGLLKVSPQASSEQGMLEVRFTATTDLATDSNAMIIQTTGAVFLN